MQGIEIKEKIDANNKAIEELMNPSKFTLNNEVAALLQENSVLQMQCDHVYEEGHCIWCYKEAPNE